MSHITEQIRVELGRFDGLLPRIAKQSGVSASWLRLFACGHIKEPAPSKLLRLADTLGYEVTITKVRDWSPRTEARHDQD